MNAKRILHHSKIQTDVHEIGHAAAAIHHGLIFDFVEVAYYPDRAAAGEPGYSGDGRVIMLVFQRQKRTVHLANCLSFSRPVYARRKLCGREGQLQLGDIHPGFAVNWLKKTSVSGYDSNLVCPTTKFGS